MVIQRHLEVVAKGVEVVVSSDKLRLLALSKNLLQTFGRLQGRHAYIRSDNLSPYFGKFDSKKALGLFLSAVPSLWPLTMQSIEIQLPDTVFSALRKAPEEFVQEMRVAAAVKWYELGDVSQGKAAEIAGLSRAGFIDALTRYKVSVFQYSAEELAQELGDAG